MTEKSRTNWQRHAALGASLMFLLVAILRIPVWGHGDKVGGYLASFGFAMTSFLWSIIWWKRPRE